MIIRAFAVIAVLATAAPAAAQSPMPAMSMAPGSGMPGMSMPAKVKAKYSCHNLVVPVTYDNLKHVAHLKYGSRRYTLPQVASADGGRYMNASLEWWSKGSGATLSSVTGGKADAVLASCAEIRKQ